MYFRKEEHMKQHVHDDDTVISCSTCDESFSRKTDYDAHCRLQHSLDVALHQCGECGQTCGSKQALDKHMLRHTGKKS